MIPRLIHFVWAGPPLPDWAERNIAEFRRLNGDYEVRLHGADVLLERYRPAYERLIQRCPVSAYDLLRYSALQRWAGWYWDTDYWPLRSIDSLVEAYGLDGRRAFVTEQHGHRGQDNPRLRIANGCLGVPANYPLWADVDEAVEALCRSAPRSGRPRRTRLGPELWTRLVDAHPDDFAVGAWPWFYPMGVDHPDLYGHYRRLLAGKDPARTFRRVMRVELRGQLPYAMHLWAGGKANLPGVDPEVSPIPVSPAASPSPPGGSGPPVPDGHGDDGDPSGDDAAPRVGIVATDGQWQSGPLRAIAGGLERLGCQVRRRSPEATLASGFDHDPRMLVLWNGRKKRYRKIVDLAGRAGRIVLRLEHGFLGDRRAHTQVDHVGILHWASWVGELGKPAPPAGAERLRRFRPEPLRAFEPREGYVLILAQVPGDSQMDDSEISHPRQLVEAVAAALPAGVAAAWRPHPQRAARSGAMPRYLPLCPAPSLAEAIDGARLALTINSNAGNEALARGCPVLCFGPSVYDRGGVAQRTSLKTLRQDLRRMLAGAYQPDSAAVANYLRWLACRQWSHDELAHPDVVRELTRRALDGQG